MSLQAGTTRDPILIERLVLGTQGAAGGQTRSYTTAARGTLPTNALCRLQPTSDRENEQYGIKAPDRGWKLLHCTNPSLTVADVVTFTDADGVVHTQVRVTEPSRDLDNQGRVYRTILEEKLNRQ